MAIDAEPGLSHEPDEASGFELGEDSDEVDPQVATDIVGGAC